MPRLGKVISASLRAGAAIVVLAVCAGTATPSAADSARVGRSLGSCRAQGAATLAADRVAVVFSSHGSVYACLQATGARRKLGSAGVCNLAPGRVAPVRLAGEIVAYGLARCGVDTGSSSIVVRDLVTGKRLANVPAGTIARGPESYVLVESLVLTGGGGVGWIAVDESLVRTRPSIYEVHRFMGAKSALLDHGSAIDPASLRLAGSRMTWRNGQTMRSARLK
jgi:hypothetical protein